MITTLLLISQLAFAGSDVVETLDGDTVRINGVSHRLYGIDAPEKKQPNGMAAGYGLAAIMQHAHDTGGMAVETHGKGKYGRPIITLHYKNKAAGTTVQAAMIRKGHAWVYWQYCQRPECEAWGRLERIAKQRQIGLWADLDAMPPWKWRHRPD